jgi:hypothetical protein
MRMHTNVEPVYRLVWNEAAGEYQETGELIGYQALDAKGKVLAYGETRSEAWENAVEAEWGTRRDEDASSDVAIAR